MTTPTSGIQMIFNASGSAATRAYENEMIGGLLEKLAQKLHTKSPVKNIEIDVRHQKNAAGKTTSFSVTLAVRLMSGKIFYAKSHNEIAKLKGVGLATAVREAFREIERQYEKTKR